MAPTFKKFLTSATGIVSPFDNYTILVFILSSLMLFYEKRGESRYAVVHSNIKSYRHKLKSQVLTKFSQELEIVLSQTLDKKTLDTTNLDAAS